MMRLGYNIKYCDTNLSKSDITSSLSAQLQETDRFAPRVSHTHTIGLLHGFVLDTRCVLLLRTPSALSNLIRMKFKTELAVGFANIVRCRWRRRWQTQNSVIVNVVGIERR